MRRKIIGYVREKFGYSERRACRLVRFNRSTLHYRSKEQPFNDALRMRIREIALKRIHYGFRRVHAVLRREGWVAGIDRVKRLYRLEGLNLRPKQRKRRRSDVQRDVAMVALGPNEVWSMDFMHDRFASGASYRLLTVVDIYTRECIALVPAQRLSSADVIEVLNVAIRKRGKPRALRCDNGSEFASIAVDQWAYWNQIQIDFSRPGKPTDNAFCESFNGTVRKELLNASWFVDLAAVKKATREWQRHYNAERLHRSLGHKTPEEFARTAKSQLAS